MLLDRRQFIKLASAFIGSLFVPQVTPIVVHTETIKTESAWNIPWAIAKPPVYKQFFPFVAKD